MGLLYLRARWYDPDTGRFLTKDPFPGLTVFPQTQHPYVYCHNDPVNYTDPSGRFVGALIVSTLLSGAIAAGVAGVAYARNNPCENIWQSSGFWKAVGIGFVSGAVGGLVGGLVGYGVGAVAGALVAPLLPTAGLGGWIAAGVVVGVVSGAAGGAAGGAAAQLVSNVLWGRPLWGNVGQAALAGAIIGGVLGGILGGIGGARAYGQYQAAAQLAGRAQPSVKQSNVGANRQRGNAFRDWIAEGFRRMGYQADIEVYKQTPFGPRYIDVEVSDPSGRVLGGIEAKVGGSPYKPSQRAKDAWLAIGGYIVNVVRDR